MKTLDHQNSRLNWAQGESSEFNEGLYFTFIADIEGCLIEKSVDISESIKSKITEFMSDEPTEWERNDFGQMHEYYPREAEDVADIIMEDLQ